MAQVHWYKLLYIQMSFCFLSAVIHQLILNVLKPWHHLSQISWIIRLCYPKQKLLDADGDTTDPTWNKLTGLIWKCVWLRFEIFYLRSLSELTRQYFLECSLLQLRFAPLKPDLFSPLLSKAEVPRSRSHLWAQLLVFHVQWLKYIDINYYIFKRHCCFLLVGIH